MPLVVRGHNSWDSTTLCVQVPLSYVGLWRLLHAVQSDPFRVHVHLEEAEEDKKKHVSSLPLISSGCRDTDRSLCLPSFTSVSEYAFVCLPGFTSVSKYTLSVSLVLRRFYRIPNLSVSLVLRRFHWVPSLSVSLVLCWFHRIPSLSHWFNVGFKAYFVCLPGFTSVSKHTLSVFLVLRRLQSILCLSSWFYISFKGCLVCLSHWCNVGFTGYLVFLPGFTSVSQDT